MENEKKITGLEGIAVHDVIVYSTHQRVDGDGKKLGYSFYEKDQVGLVIQASPTKIVMLLPNKEELVYDTEKPSKEYCYTICKGSDIEYKNEIVKAIVAQQKNVDKEWDEINALRVWLDEFENTISFIGKLKRFVKEFNN